MRRFNYSEMHELLIDVCLSEQYLATDWVATQALHCPYYVPLSGRLGADWGVVVNPESRRFRLLTFEHDDCGCPGDVDRHRDLPEQDGDIWWTDPGAEPRTGSGHAARCPTGREPAGIRLVLG